MESKKLEEGKDKLETDTLKIKYKEQEGSIRLIGVDIPESKANKKAKSHHN